MNPWEIIRIIIFTVIGAVLMFLGQRLIYENQIIPIQKVPLDTWLAADYTTAALIMFGVCLFSTIFWCVLGAMSKSGGSSRGKWLLIWFLLGLLPLLTIAFTVFYINRSDEAQFSLMCFFLFDAIWLYWLNTATSSPETVKYIPPGAFFIRHKLMGD
ncbi:MAG: hypothetical protein ACKO9I_12530 [Sphaerospermopsis kisseleviana]|uniref:Uncharacterized protein n=2 Tax=Sphaerospermopsis TaxID=752201 RepID=A0A479ZUR1_9CYAN|nr:MULTISPECIES: hypothetical protein [Sphaerospermopsis]BAZ83399.1 hypothetical protein NIES73_46860 [Sphaerospermopsis kisseleviana NIES-73]MBD2131295.1 hypothetical protein [Sphaerospermopsis sp. FACHB-1094]MBD2145658.1 hypothetical protein [Sphaerospermopsis sp. FACHB-1194]MDB9442123.1 hypothetical protein [Sphaerospermopsis kisseleviana CS-549]GCL35233.1 hypothetical protein SR1949_03250 [Sphaerospermopsis reniformis]